MDKNKEIILAVPDAIVKEIQIPTGVSILSPEEIASFIAQLSPHVIADERGKFEGNPEFRQLIPYISIQFRTDKGDVFFNAVRTKEGGDNRLHGKKLIGFGGHANPVEMQYIETFSSKLRVNANRELDEELDIPHGYSLFFKGFINDYSTPVNCDHLGIYMTAIVGGAEDVSIKETSVLVEPSFASIDDLKDINAYGLATAPFIPLESWSAMVLDALYQVEQGM